MNRQGGIIDGKRTKEYAAWQNMRGRCLNPKLKCWKNYGGRGITICKEWDSFAVFLRDMGEAPKGYSLDRIDNDKGYYAANCWWATKSQQESNKRKRAHCRKGHEYTPKNTIQRKTGRCCRECQQAANLAWYYKNKINKEKLNATV